MTHVLIPALRSLHSPGFPCFSPPFRTNLSLFLSHHLPLPLTRPLPSARAHLPARLVSAAALVCRGVLPAERYGTILAIDVLEHIPHWAETVGAMVASLRPGGIIIEDTAFSPDLHPPTVPASTPANTNSTSAAGTLGGGRDGMREAAGGEGASGDQAGGNTTGMRGGGSREGAGEGAGEGEEKDLRVHVGQGHIQMHEVASLGADLASPVLYTLLAACCAPCLLRASVLVSPTVSHAHTSCSSTQTRRSSLVLLTLEAKHPHLLNLFVMLPSANKSLCFLFFSTLSSRHDINLLT